MKYLKVDEVSKKWNISTRSVRNYCHQGRIEGAFLEGKTWYIPEEASKPQRIRTQTKNKRTLLHVLKGEKDSHLSGGIYHKIQIEFTYNSNHIEGSRLSKEQTRYIFETNTIGIENEIVHVDDIVETVNHFRCIDYIIDNVNKKITEDMIKKLYFILKTGTSDSQKEWFRVGEYKKYPNEVGGRETTSPENVYKEMKELLKDYYLKSTHTLDDLLEFHVRFECIHGFQDGNGRVGRLLLFKECLKNNIVPFIIDENLKMFYYRGISRFYEEKGYLRDTCLTGQDRFKQYLDYFEIEYEK